MPFFCDALKVQLHELTNQKHITKYMLLSKSLTEWKWNQAAFSFFSILFYLF